MIKPLSFVDQFLYSLVTQHVAIKVAVKLEKYYLQTFLILRRRVSSLIRTEVQFSQQDHPSQHHLVYGFFYLIFNFRVETLIRATLGILTKQEVRFVTSFLNLPNKIHRLENLNNLENLQV